MNFNTIVEALVEGLFAKRWNSVLEKYEERERKPLPDEKNFKKMAFQFYLMGMMDLVKINEEGEKE